MVYKNDIQKVADLLTQHNSQKSAIAEREFLALFKCRQIPKLFSCFQDQTNLYYVMEYCNGGTLDEYLQSQSRPSLTSRKPASNRDQEDRSRDCTDSRDA